MAYISTAIAGLISTDAKPAKAGEASPAIAAMATAMKYTGI